MGKMVHKFNKIPDKMWTILIIWNAKIYLEDR
jgi:hypothetical protein